MKRNLMVMSMIRLSCALLAASAMFAYGVEMRSWTDAQGRKIEAKMVSSTETEVVLELANGKKSTVPLDKLSEADRSYVRTSSAKPDQAPQQKDELNFDAPWPQDIKFNEDPQIEVIVEDKDKSRFIYESANYRFVCDVRLSKQVVKGFATMFESTYGYCRALPLAMTGGDRTEGKFQILLFETRGKYIEAGGPPESAGVFSGGKKAVMVPLTSLGVRPVGSGYMLDRDQSNGTLIHEITHQLTPYSYYSPGARGWFTEGIAEYTTATPYRAGRFKVKSNFDDIVEYATAYGKENKRGRALGTRFMAPSLKGYMLMGYSQFSDSQRANFNYGFGLILTTYFLHLDGEGDAARAKNFLKALREGKKGEQAVAVLLDGRSYKELEEAVSKAWRRKGVDMDFGE
jgi:hypothetical protein